MQILHQKFDEGRLCNITTNFTTITYQIRFIGCANAKKEVEISGPKIFGTHDLRSPYNQPTAVKFDTMNKYGHTINFQARLTLHPGAVPPKSKFSKHHELLHKKPCNQKLLNLVDIPS